MYFSYVPSIIFSFFNRPFFLNPLFKQILIHYYYYYYRSPQVLATSVALSNGGERRHILRLGQPELLHQGQLPARAAGEASGSADGGRPGHVQSFGYLAADFGVKKNPTFIFISPRAKIPKYRQNIKIRMLHCILIFSMLSWQNSRNSEKKS